MKPSLTREALLEAACVLFYQRGIHATSVDAILEKPDVQQPHALVDLVKQQGYGTADRSPGRLLVESGVDGFWLSAGGADGLERCR